MTVVGCCTIAHGKTISSLDAIFYTESFLDLSESTDMVLLRPVKVKSNAVMIRHNFPYVRRRRIRIHRQSKHLQQIILIFVLEAKAAAELELGQGTDPESRLVRTRCSRNPSVGVKSLAVEGTAVAHVVDAAFSELEQSLRLASREP